MMIVLFADSERYRKEKKKRTFDFTKYNTRHVAMKIAYLGWDYLGYASQEDTTQTIESALFDALIKTKLVESRETCSYSRCGRTDRGVSALSQVIALDLRTNLLSGKGVKQREGGSASERQGDKETEIRYVHILNKVLPPDIRVWAWCPVEEDFSARFSCRRRTYKYFFPRANLDLAAMRDAASRLIGEHDFRNLCKMSVHNGVTNYVRTILAADVALSEHCSQGRYEMCVATICGYAFIWHQIRCIMSVLFLVGQGKEKPSIVDQLLDIEQNPCKPQYPMASELPLVLYDCEFDDIEWLTDTECQLHNIQKLQKVWAQHEIQAVMTRHMLQEFDSANVRITGSGEEASSVQEKPTTVSQFGELQLLLNEKMHVYKPLLQREKAESLEDRIAYHEAKKRKLDPETITMSSGSDS